VCKCKVEEAILGASPFRTQLPYFAPDLRRYRSRKIEPILFQQRYVGEALGPGLPFQTVKEVFYWAFAPPRLVVQDFPGHLETYDNILVIGLSSLLAVSEAVALSPLATRGHLRIIAGGPAADTFVSG